MSMKNLVNCFVWLIGMGMGLSSIHALADQITRPAAGVTRVVFNSVGDLVVKPGTEEKLLVEAEAKVLALLDISVKGETITLATKGTFRTNKGIKYTLTVKSFRGLKTGAAGNSSVEGFAGPDVDIELGGSGDVALTNMKPGRLSIVIKDSGSVVASGSGKSVVARVDGAGNIDTTAFQAQNVDAKLDGSGTIRVHADETLKASIGGAGNIEYKGKAKVTQSVTGAGSVDRI